MWLANWSKKTGKTISYPQGHGREVVFEPNLISFQSVNPLVMMDIVDSLEGTINVRLIISSLFDMGPFYSQKSVNEITLKVVKSLSTVDKQTLFVFVHNLVKRKQFTKVIVIGLPIDQVYELCQEYDKWKGPLVDLDIFL